MWDRNMRFDSLNLIYSMGNTGEKFKQAKTPVIDSKSVRVQKQNKPKYP